ncbi:MULTISPECIES: long-chain-fatty-acid--CoA ligase [Deinococcus]|uniref:Long-chain-fatty-acid--CoA ligase n=1 Tax=Deinococcus daejeonensis TaxID=1007098 RepID=A0ABQ2JJU5_9DEIO|nr:MULTISPECIES: long-chain-fatty-acid--CoA ligase [Deinococcus]RIY14564.1 long-chain fatty acid--CoA ligase [Deinococcus sp. RM]GGN47384.1 long-chain-fatty-acid--CoA ligase [Deinococcus daejeonensis]
MTQTARYWPEGKPRTLTLPRTGVMHNLRVSAERYPDRVALWHYGRTWTYAQLHEQATRLAGHLAARGVQRGDRVAVWMQNSPEWAIAAFAAWQLGAVVVPLAPMLQAREFGFFLQDAGIRTGVVGAELYDRARQAGLGHAVVANVMRGAHATPGVPIPDGLDVTPELHGDDVTLETALQAAPAPEAPVTADDLCIMPYTSGTTGLPKGCMHTHRSVQANVFGAGAWVDGNVEDVFLAALPFFHVTGFINSLMSALSIGAQVVIMSRWDRDAARTLIRDHTVTLWTNTPTMVIDLMASPNFDPADLRSLRNVTGGGASLPAAVGQRLLDQTGIMFLEGYGLSETMAQSHSNPKGRQKLQCLGVPLFNVDARIVDLDSGRELPVGETGEIVLRGPQVMQGYWNRPDATAEAFTEISGERFFRTGDLGYMDDEGYFYFADRLKRMVNVSGMKVWPAEVENQLHAHPAIQEACVISVPDDRSGERARALVVLRPGASATPAELEGWAREQMATYKVPRDWQFVESLPRSPTGKVAWRQLQEAARAAMA